MFALRFSVSSALLSMWAAGLSVSAAAQADGPPASSTGAREVSLDELLAYAERHAPATHVAESRLGYAEAARAHAAPLLRQNPSLDFGMGPRINDASERDYDYIVGLTQPIEIAGERKRRLETASRQRERLEAEADAVRWEIRRDVLLAYAAAVVQRERLTIVEKVVRFVDELLRVTRLRLDAGDATAIDVRIAEADAARARQAQLGAEADLQAARIRLAEVTGWAIEAPPNVPLGLGGIRPAPSLAAMMSTAQEQHPELRARRAAVAEAEARGALARRDAWPSPVLGIQVAREGATGGPANHIVLGTLGLELPLWQRNQGERALRRADEAVARAEESAETRALQARIARAHAELAAAYERISLFTSNVAPRLEESLSMLERGFEAGELPWMTVAIARERFIEAKKDALVAYGDYFRARAELEFALGAELPAASPESTVRGAP